MSLSPQVPGELLFLNEWFSRPWGRRQAWARGILELGMLARTSGHAISTEEVLGILLDASATAEKSHSVTLTLRRAGAQDAQCLGRLDRLPAFRRCAWLRETLVMGFDLNMRLPEILRQSRGTGVHSKDIDQGALIFAQKSCEPKENSPNSVTLALSREKLRENLLPAGRKIRSIKEKVQDVPVTLSQQVQPALARVAEQSSVNPMIELDLDLSDTASGPVDEAAEAGVTPKRKELLGLFV